MTLFICLNIAMGALVSPGVAGSPISIEITNPNWNNTSTSNCFYDGSTRPSSDPLNATDSLNDTGLLPSPSIGGFRDELLYPTNQTNINGTLSGDTLPFDSIFNSVEQIGKTLEMMKHFVLGGFIEDVIDNVAFNCYFDQDTGQLTSGADHALIDNIKNGVYIIFGVLMIITVFYWITGRGHILSS
jgi:hypothetical protein